MKNIISRFKEKQASDKKKSSTARDREDTMILRARIQDKLAQKPGGKRS